MLFKTLPECLSLVPLVKDNRQDRIRPLVFWYFSFFLVSLIHLVYLFLALHFGLWSPGFLTLHLSLLVPLGFLVPGLLVPGILVH